MIRYASGDGNDTIRGFNESDTLTITGGSYTTQTSGNDVIVKVGSGNILLQDAKGKSLNINKTGTNKFITLNEDNYTFLNKINGATLNGGAGNDRIWNAAENENVTINGSAGNDEIYNDGAKTSIIGGTGNDSINSGLGNDSIIGGDGNDVFIYKPNEDTDTIYDYASGAAIC